MCDYGGRLMHGTHLQIEIEARLLIDFHKNRGHGHSLKTIVLRGDRVRPGKKIVDTITAEFVAGNGSDEPCVVVARDYENRCDRGRFFIVGVAEEAARGHLGERWNTEYEEYKE